MVQYRYDAWGNCKVLNASGIEITDDTHIGILNPFRYRSYYFDTETNLYFLKTRYYDPEIGRFMTIDDIGYLDPESINGLNLYAYCGNNPVNCIDRTGQFWDYIFDAVFLVWSVIDFLKDPSDWKNWVALGVDIIFAVIPFVPSGAGQLIKIGSNIDNVIDLTKAVNKLDDLNDLSKITVIGQSMDRVRSVGRAFNTVGNLYGGFTAYNRIADTGKLGKVFAEMIAKPHNAFWLMDKLRRGYTVLDIGIDITKVAKGITSSSYAMERIITMLWKTRNIWKLPLNYFC